MSEKAQKILVKEGGVGVTRKGIQWPSELQGAYKGRRRTPRR